MRPEAGVLTSEIASLASQSAISSADFFPETRGKSFHLVIGDPTLLPAEMDQEKWEKAGILYQVPVEQGSADARQMGKFGRIARGKAYLSWRYQLPTGAIQAAPHLLQSGSTTYYGSVCRDGLVVAVSGLPSYFDEMVAGWVADSCIALCRHRLAIGEVAVNDEGFLPQFWR